MGPFAFALAVGVRRDAVVGAVEADDVEDEDAGVGSGGGELEAKMRS